MNENEMLEEIKSLSPSEEAILTMLIRYQNLKVDLEKEKEKNREQYKEFIKEHGEVCEKLKEDINKEWEAKIKEKIKWYEDFRGSILYEKYNYEEFVKDLQSLLEEE